MRPTGSVQCRRREGEVQTGETEASARAHGCQRMRGGSSGRRTFRMRLRSGPTSSRRELKSTALGPSGSLSFEYLPARGRGAGGAPARVSSSRWRTDAAAGAGTGPRARPAPLRIPRQSGLYPMNCTPSSRHASTRPDVSGARLRRLYCTWLLTRGTPRFDRYAWIFRSCFGPAGRGEEGREGGSGAGGGAGRGRTRPGAAGAGWGASGRVGVGRWKHPGERSPPGSPHRSWRCPRPRRGPARSSGPSPPRAPAPAAARSSRPTCGGG